MSKLYDPSLQLRRGLAAMLSGLIGEEVTATRVFNPPPLRGRTCVVALYSFMDGTSGAVMQLDLLLACQLAVVLTGDRIPPLAQIEATGKLTENSDDAIREVCNVIGGMFNYTKRRMKLTGVSIQPVNLDTSEVGGSILPCAIAWSKMPGGRLDLRGRAVDEIMASAKEEAKAAASAGTNLEDIAKLFSGLLKDICDRKVIITTGATLSFTSDLTASVGAYAQHGGEVAMLVVSEIGLSGFMGAAPLKIPLIFVQEQIRRGQLESTVLDGLHEVYNVLTAPYAVRHIRLSSMHWMPGKLPQSVSKLIPANGRVAALNVEIEGFGKGKMALLGDYHIETAGTLAKAELPPQKI